MGNLRADTARKRCAMGRDRSDRQDRRSLVAHALEQPEHRQQVVRSRKRYDRKRDKQQQRKDIE